MAESSTKPPEEVRRELVRRWQAKAEEDIGVADHLITEDSPYLTSIAFHAHQAAEKFLKSVLVHHQVPFPKTHNLGELLDLLAAADPALADSLKDCTSLNPYAADYRYPGEAAELSREEAREAIVLAKQVRQMVRASLADA